MTYQILIVEDEPFVSRRLARLAGELLSDHDPVTDCADSVSGALALLETKDVDLIFLDLNLAGEDGFDLLKRFTAKAAHTIVVSAHTDRAVEAFEYGVLDFVPKPFTKARLGKAVSRLWRQAEPQDATAKHLSFEVRTGIEVVALTDIMFFKGADKYSEAVLTTGATKFHGKSLNRLEQILGADFIRTHKSYLVHRGAITGVKSLEGSRYALWLSNGESLPVGRTRVDHVRQLVGVGAL